MGYHFPSLTLHISFKHQDIYSPLVLVELGLDALADAWLVLLLIRTVVLAAGVRFGLGVI